MFLVTQQPMVKHWNHTREWKEDTKMTRTMTNWYIQVDRVHKSCGWVNLQISWEYILLICMKVPKETMFFFVDIWHTSSTDRLNSFAMQVGLNINPSKAKVICMYSIPNATITVNNEPLEYVNNFTYLGSLIRKDNAAQKDMQARLGKATGAFARLKTVWKSSQYSTTTKSCCMAQSAGELLRPTWTRSVPFTMDASGRYVVYLAY